MPSSNALPSWASASGFDDLQPRVEDHRRPAAAQLGQDELARARPSALPGDWAIAGACPSGPGVADGVAVRLAVAVASGAGSSAGTVTVFVSPPPPHPIRNATSAAPIHRRHLPVHAASVPALVGRTLPMAAAGRGPAPKLSPGAHVLSSRKPPLDFLPAPT